MKVATFGVDIQPGKHKYSPECFDKLVEKFSPQKVSPYTVEFIGEDFEKADAIVFAQERRFDFIFFDLEKVEKRSARTADDAERTLLGRIQGMLEKEQLLCEAEFSGPERTLLQNMGFVTYTPSLAVEGVSIDDTNGVIRQVLEKAGVLLFYTAGKKEVHAWSVRRGSSIVEAAGRIHSDLARGFIKADITKCADLDNFFNMAEARAKGYVQTVGKDYLVKDGDIIEVKFNV